MLWKKDPQLEGRVVGEGVLLIGVIRLSCYTYNQKPGGFRHYHGSSLGRLLPICLDLVGVLLGLLYVTALGRALR